jgi:hypothetical protein
MPKIELQPSDAVDVDAFMRSLRRTHKLGDNYLNLGYATIPAGLVIPASVTTLYLGHATILAGLVIPASVTTLDLGYATIPAGLVIPASVTTLYLSAATIPAGLVIPASVTTLSLSTATIPAGLVIPASVTTLDLNGKKVPCKNGVIFISGEPWMAIITDNHVSIGCQTHTIKQWLAFSPKNIANMDSDAISYMDAMKTAILAAIDTAQGSADRIKRPAKGN